MFSYSKFILYEIPVFRWLAALISGILLAFFSHQYSTPLQLPKFLIPTILLLAIAILFLFDRKADSKTQFAYRIYTGIFIFLLLILVSFFLAYRFNYNLPKNHYLQVKDSCSLFEIRVTEPPILKKNKWKMEAEVVSGFINNTRFKLSGDIVLWVEINDYIPKYGDHFLIKTNVRSFDEPLNPYQFNYKKYQWFHKKFGCALVKKNDWKATSVNSSNSFFKFTYSLRERLIWLLKKYIQREVDKSVAENLIIGYKYDMDAETMKAYSASGALHVLSVSGLHIGVLYLVLDFLLLFMDRKKSWRIIKLILLLTVISYYALLTGFGPSVLRSVVMCTFLLIAKTFKLRTNTYNVLGASALCLILFQPYIIFDVGFQLSYAAVWGILFIYPKLYLLLIFESSWFDKIWGLITVSLAAQIATLPLGFFYFHQFPLYFLPANLIVVPLGNIALITGMILFTVSPIPYLNTSVGFVLNKSVYFLNEIIFNIQTWPNAVLHGFVIDFTQMLLLFLVIIFSVIAFTRFFFRDIFIFLVSLVAFLVLLKVDKIQKRNYKELIFYSGLKEPTMCLISSHSAYTVSDSLYRQEFTVAEHWNQNRVLNHRLLFENKNEVFLYKSELYNYWNIDTIHVIQMHHNFNSMRVPSVNDSAYLWICANCNPPTKMYNYFPFRVIILDGSISYSTSKKWKTFATEHKIAVHDLKKEKALQIIPNWVIK